MKLRYWHIIYIFPMEENGKKDLILGFICNPIRIPIKRTLYIIIIILIIIIELIILNI